MKKTIKYFILPFIFLILSITFIFLVLFVDKRAIGPKGTSVGLATINNAVFNFFGVKMIWYTITDWIGVIAILIACMFFIWGLVEWIKRKNPFKADKEILFLGGVYFIIIWLYILFEYKIVNYRPIIMPGAKNPEASFPSSHTLITCTICGTAIFAIKSLVKSKKIQIFTLIFCGLIIFITIVGRLISGVHWFSDIVAGVLFSTFFITLYYAIIKIFCKH